MKPALIAKIAHEINRAYCQSLGDNSQPAWEDAPDWQKDSASAGVAMHIENPDATPEQSHVSWLAAKIDQGWKYGPVKNSALKEHPCCVPYDELPVEQKAKDYLFRAVVHQLKDVPDEAGVADTKVEVQVQTEQRPGFTLIKYLGNRERHRENLYGTGLEFIKGGTCWVPTDKANLMLKHPDVYAVATEAEAKAPEAAASPVAHVVDTESDEAKEKARLEELENARQSLGTMTKEGLIQYAKHNFQVDLDPAMKKAELQTRVVGLFDQFGPLQ